MLGVLRDRGWCFVGWWSCLKHPLDATCDQRAPHGLRAIPPLEGFHTSYSTRSRLANPAPASQIPLPPRKWGSSA